MTPTDDLLKRAKELRDAHHLCRTDTEADALIDDCLTALESDRALLRRIVEAVDGYTRSNG